MRSCMYICTICKVATYIVLYATQEIANEAWKKYLLRNKSIIVKLFQGQLKSTLVCPDCKKVHTIANCILKVNVRYIVIQGIKGIQPIHVRVPAHQEDERAGH